MGNEKVEPQNDSINIIETNDELENYLSNSGVVPEPGQGKKKAVQGAEEDEGEEGENEARRSGKKKPAVVDVNHPDYKLPEDDSGEEEEDTEEEEFTNVVDYIDKEFNLGLNTKELPENMTREQEAEMVAEILRRADSGYRARLNEYKTLNELLKDKEVAEFLRFKKEGKTLKDIASVYATESSTAPDDVLVSRHIKKMYPSMTDAEVAEEIQDLKTKNKLEKRAASAREYFKGEDTAEQVRKERIKQEAEAQAETEYKQDVARFGNFLQNTQKVYGITITPQMKKQVFAAVTARDEEGLTQHDRMLQSDAGVFLSSLGLMYMKDLLRNGTTKKANEAKKNFKDRLFSSPDKLQSGSEAKHEPEINMDIANQF